jgi:hypothetical protein
MELPYLRGGQVPPPTPVPAAHHQPSGRRVFRPFSAARRVWLEWKRRAASEGAAARISFVSIRGAAGRPPRAAAARETEVRPPPPRTESKIPVRRRGRPPALAALLV